VKNVYLESEHTVTDKSMSADGLPANSGLPNRLMTAFEVANLVAGEEVYKVHLLSEHGGLVHAPALADEMSRRLLWAM